MGAFRYLALVAMLTVTACAGPRTAAGPQEEYVEIDNPAYTMSPTASPTIWVPRRYVESGVPRGSQLLKKGYEEVVGKGTPAPVSPREGLHQRREGEVARKSDLAGID
ncbi:hypothetical protein [Geobacter pickeringii]|uniref:hypothetical protein n=1 Tax=Geobacter pickeringii TaxID=345632 RepID=UPI00068C1ECA|nr:hypothetical protein [Geobacter pickeringii]